MGLSEKNEAADGETLELEVSFLTEPKRIDVFMAERLKERFSRSEIQSFLKNGRILLNGRPAKPSVVVRDGDRISSRLDVSAKTSPLLPEDLPLSVIYEDEDLLVIDKAAGMVVHPGAAAKKGTLVHALLGRGTKLSGSGPADRPGIVHRLDKDTSGVLIVAKNNRAHRAIQAQFESRSVKKIYTALVRGRVDFEEGHIEKSIGRDPKIRRKMAVSREGSGKEALTRYRTLRRFAKSTLLEVRILTGRTHQIRVHLAHLGHPVLGDELYGKKESAPRPRVLTRGTSVGAEESPVISRLCLHASKIEFQHPRTDKMMRFESPLPADFQAAVDSQTKENS